jgi:3-dehydroquinate synthase
LNIDLHNIKYEIIIEPNLINDICREIKKVCSGKKAAVITDENLFSIYGENLKKTLKENFKIDFIVIKPGEKSKSLDVVKNVYESLLRCGITRGDLIIAFGGGVVGDLAGFAASTFLRGIDYVQIPTSLIAQVDSSVGGKVGINLSEGKNLVGSFYHPKMVLIDPFILRSLPEKNVRDGLGEVIKYACIQDNNFYDMLLGIKSNDELFNVMEEIIFRCCSIKKHIVESDEKDKGLRMTLNFGHTLGHALEKYYSYEYYTHGEAVAIGMNRITEKSESLGYTKPGTSKKIKSILQNFNIDYKFPDVNKNIVRDLILLDKKNISGNMNLVLLKEVGNAFIENIKLDNLDIFI